MSEKATASIVVENLVQRAAEGDHAAQEALLLRYRPFIRVVVRARLGHKLRGKESTRDVEQEVALAVLRSLKGQRWQGQRAFIAWLRRVASAEVIDLARYHEAQRRRSDREVDFDDGRAKAAGASPESWLDEQRRLDELAELLHELPEKQAQALMLFHQGHTHAEIGEVLECSEEAARKQVARGRAKLTSLRAKKT